MAMGPMSQPSPQKFATRSRDRGYLQVLDLAGGDAWTGRADEKMPIPVRVPSGGWNSDQQPISLQVMSDVDDCFTYERQFNSPIINASECTWLEFDGVNYGCCIFIDGISVGEHHGPHIPFSIDVTPFIRSGESQVLQVRTFHRRHYQDEKACQVPAGWDYPGGIEGSPTHAEALRWSHWAGNSKVGYGITRGVRLVVLPAVRVDDVHIHTSVSQREWSADVWIINQLNSDAIISMTATLGPWGKESATYPMLPDEYSILKPQSTTHLKLGPVQWDDGPTTFWWPNIPYSKTYKARFHTLQVHIKGDDLLDHTFNQRFGFVEHAEGDCKYSVNGVPFFGIGDATAEGQTSDFDAYATTPAFVEPDGSIKGCPETWRRYQEMGFNVNRLHCSVPTEFMLDSADEAGFPGGTHLGQ